MQDLSDFKIRHRIPRPTHRGRADHIRIDYQLSQTKALVMVLAPVALTKMNCVE
jgi:hypothetical protein